MNILITGASSGIGEEISLLYAKKDNNLTLIARNQSRLQNVAEKCKEQGANVQVHQLDVTDKSFEDNIKKIAKNKDFDILIANAGMNLLERFNNLDTLTTDTITNLFKTNFEGQLKTIFPLLPGISRKKGQVVIMSSISAERGLPQDPAYCATKAALSIFFEGVRAEWAKHNIGVTIVYPGFVTTPLSDKITSIKPFTITAKKAAKIIKKGIDKQKLKVIFPIRLRILFAYRRLLPARILDKLLAYF